MTHWSKWLPESLFGSLETVHFATWRISSWQARLSEAERDAVARVLRQRRDQRCRLLAFVVMDDHVHVLVRCSTPSIGRLIESWKAFSAHCLRENHGRAGDIWQRDAFHRTVRDESDMRARSHYIVGNPWKRWPFLQRYPWVWEETHQARSMVS